MFRLRLLGSAIIEGPDGPLHDAVAQRAALALLALLARSPGGTVSRDKAVGMLWPESTDARARGRLRTTLHSLRRALAPEVILSRGDDLALNAAQVSSDVDAFEKAVAEDRLETAASLYGGPFLDGFHLNGAGVLDRWAEEERAELARTYENTLERLAASADDRGDITAAAKWWDRLSRQRPESERIIVHAMRAAALAGDRSRALEQADRYEALLRDEYGAEPGAEVMELARSIRFAPGSAAGGRTGDPAGEPQPEPAANVGPLPVGRIRARRRRVWAAGAVLAAIGGAMFMGQPRSDARAGALAPGRVLVGPFANLSGSPELASLGGVASDWLAQELAGTGMVEVLPWTLLARETPALAEARDTSRSEAAAIRLAAQVGAGTVVTGSYVVRRDSLVLHARIADVGTGALLRAIEAPPVPRRDHLHAIEALRSHLAGALATVLDPRLAAWSHAASQPPSFAAYRLFTSGIDAWLGESFADADSLFLAAAALDTTFTAPLVWAIRSAWETPNVPRARELIVRLERRHGLLAPWDQAMLRYYRAQLDNNWEESYRHARRMAEIAPVSEWLLLWSQSAMATLRFQEALDVARRLDYDAGWLLGWPYPRRLPAQLLHLLGDYVGELRSAALMDDVLPGSADRARLRALAAAGRLQEHADLLERTAAGLDADNLHGLLDEVAAELTIHGRAEAARAARQRRDALLPLLTPAGHPLRIPRALRSAGNFEEARSGFMAVLDQDVVPREVVLKELALTDALAGDSAGALRLLDSAFGQMPEQEWVATETARVHAAFGDLDGAVRILRRARRNGAGFHFYMHLADSALVTYPPYRALMRPRS